MVTLALLGLTPLKCLSPGGLTVDNNTDVSIRLTNENDQ